MKSPTWIVWSCLFVISVIPCSVSHGQSLWSEAMASTGAFVPSFADTDDVFNVIGGGRKIPTAIFDKNWTRMIMLYGGWEGNRSSGSDVFEGTADIDSGVFGIDIGRRHSDYLRSSIDFTYRNGDISNATAADVGGDLEIYSLMKNFHLDFPTRPSGIQPYVGFGVGVGYADSVGTFNSMPAFIEGETAFAYQGMAGLAYKFSEVKALYTEYRFFSLQDVDLVSGGNVTAIGNYSGHNVLFGVRFGF